MSRNQIIADLEFAWKRAVEFLSEASLINLNDKLNLITTEDLTKKYLLNNLVNKDDYVKINNAMNLLNKNSISVNNEHKLMSLFNKKIDFAVRAVKDLDGDNFEFSIGKLNNIIKFVSNVDKEHFYNRVVESKPRIFNYTIDTIYDLSNLIEDKKFTSILLKNSVLGTIDIASKNYNKTYFIDNNLSPMKVLESNLNTIKEISKSNDVDKLVDVDLYKYSLDNLSDKCCDFLENEQNDKGYFTNIDWQDVSKLVSEKIKELNKEEITQNKVQIKQKQIFDIGNI